MMLTNQPNEQPVQSTAAEAWQGTGGKNGLLAGVYTIAAFSIVYALNPTWMLHRAWFLGSFLIYIALMFRAALTSSGEVFRDVVRPPFVVFIVANLLFHLFYYILFTFIDPGLYDVQLKLLAEAGQLPNKADRESLIMTPAKSLFTYINSLIGGFALSSVIAFIVLKTRR
jgi:hypothetical protein